MEFSQFDRFLPQSFYTRSTITVARDLLGKYLVRRLPSTLLVGLIRETEAYLGPQDQAAHARFGLTPRTAPLFGPAGHAYIYQIYGKYYCFNVVTETVGSGTGVLIRAVTPVQGLTRPLLGPGLVCQGLQLDTSFSGMALIRSSPLFLAHSGLIPSHIQSAPRIGVAYSGRWANRLLRYCWYD